MNSRGGRPTKFTAELGREILALTRQGVSRKVIAGQVGVGLRTLQAWLAKGRAGDPPLRDWAEQVTKAWLRAHQEHIWSTIPKRRAEGRDRWLRFRASREAWWLERLGPVEFWRRRLNWLVSKGPSHEAALRQAVERLRAQGFRIFLAP